MLRNVGSLGSRTHGWAARSRGLEMVQWEADPRVDGAHVCGLAAGGKVRMRRSLRGWRGGLETMDLLTKLVQGVARFGFVMGCDGAGGLRRGPRPSVALLVGSASARDPNGGAHRDDRRVGRLKMERGRALRWVAGDEALIASRRTPSATFAIIEPSKEAHDSSVSEFSADARGVRGASEPISAPGPAGHNHQTREIASARCRTTRASQ